jgi:hypothetical protein
LVTTPSEDDLLDTIEEGDEEGSAEVGTGIHGHFTSIMKGRKRDASEVDDLEPQAHDKQGKKG